MEQQLARAEDRIIKREIEVSLQRQFVAEIEQDRHDSTKARKLLATLEKTLALAYADRDRLHRELAKECRCQPG